MKKNIFYKKGFTIIETMISISIFLIVITIGMNALLNASFVHRKALDQTSIMDGLSFMMEDMSRNIRTGYSLRCISSGIAFSTSDVSNTPQDCPAGGGAIIFENAVGIPQGGDNGGISCGDCLLDQWAYYIEAPGLNRPFNLYKSINGGNSSVQLNSDEIKLDSESRFYVTGAVTGEEQQPLVKIVLKGVISYKKVDYPFSLQTTVSQRATKDK